MHNSLDGARKRRPHSPSEGGGPFGAQRQGIADRGDVLRGDRALRAPVVDGAAPQAQASSKLRLGDAEVVQESGEGQGGLRGVHAIWTTMREPERPYRMDDFPRYGRAVALRAIMSAALRARRLQRSLSLEQVARRVGIGKSLVHAVENNVAGEYLDRMDNIAEALGARWDIALVPEEGQGEREQLSRAVLALPASLAAELLQVVNAWRYLSADDRDLIAHLCMRRAARAGAEVVLLPETEQAPQQGKRAGS